MKIDSNELLGALRPFVNELFEWGNVPDDLYPFISASSADSGIAKFSIGDLRRLKEIYDKIINEDME